MSEPREKSKWLDNFGIEWGYRGILLLAMVAQLWLSSHYASKEDIDRQDVRLRQVEDALILQRFQSSRIDDHEARLRYLEARASMSNNHTQ